MKRCPSKVTMWPSPYSTQVDGQWAPCWQAQRPCEQVLERAGSRWPSSGLLSDPGVPQDWHTSRIPQPCIPHSDIPTSSHPHLQMPPTPHIPPLGALGPTGEVQLTRSYSQCGAWRPRGRRPPQNHMDTALGAHTPHWGPHRAPLHRHSQARTWWAPAGRAGSVASAHHSLALCSDTPAVPSGSSPQPCLQWGRSPCAHQAGTGWLPELGCSWDPTVANSDLPAAGPGVAPDLTPAWPNPGNTGGHWELPSSLQSLHRQCPWPASDRWARTRPRTCLLRTGRRTGTSWGLGRKL